ncbi:YhcB family protein [Mycobacterium sp. MYCO198283]|uniref:YhcB family protein n=1 Tax=Mycobacterium sp. MYCO198283 TaxID=2883505 RepID=UPI001E2C4185|nr:YhcB family protein [Mycobacterium sp. MYCO198283]MCG5431988.1 YhcB family protein [Mycobacterium sp. MYCO198283]
MLHDFISTVLGLIVGLVTGFYFERRATKSALTQNRMLERELDQLRTSIYSVGGVEAITDPVVEQSPTEPLETLVHDRARRTQNAEGRLRRSSLTSYFLGHGHSVDDVEAAIMALQNSGRIRDEGKWIAVR